MLWRGKFKSPRLAERSWRRPQWRQREFKVGGTSLVSRLSACLTEGSWWRLIAEWNRLEAERTLRSIGGVASETRSAGVVWLADRYLRSAKITRRIQEIMRGYGPFPFIRACCCAALVKTFTVFLCSPATRGAANVTSDNWAYLSHRAAHQRAAYVWTALESVVSNTELDVGCVHWYVGLGWVKVRLARFLCKL